MFLRKWIAAAISAISLCTAPLMGNWSTPLQVYSSTNETISSIATDGNGNCVAVWFDVPVTIPSMQAAKLSSGSVNSQGQPNWILTEPVATGSSFVTTPTNAYVQSVGMDSNGNAIAVTSSGSSAYAYTLPLGSSTWSSSTTIGTGVTSSSFKNISISVAANGNAIACWLDTEFFVAYANTYLSGAWQTDTNLFNGVSANNPFGISVATDSRGNGVVSIVRNSGYIQVSSYVIGTGWTTISSNLGTNAQSVSCAVDPSSGDATIVWLQSDSTMHAATLPFGGSSLQNLTILSSTANYSASYPVVQANAAGDVIAIWTDNTENLASARYSAGTWSTLPLFNVNADTPNVISASMDTNGNVVASWSVSDTIVNSYIQSATLKAGQSSWSQLLEVSLSDRNTNSRVILADENAIAIWEDNSPGSSIGVIYSSNFLSLFPSPPSPTPSPPSPPPPTAAHLLEILNQYGTVKPLKGIQ